MPSNEILFLIGPAGKIEAVLHLPDGSIKAIAVVAHPLPIMGGTMDNKVVTTVSKALVELGCATLRFNFRGVGLSEGIYDQGNGETQDVIAACQFLRQRYPDLPLFCAGFSFGGYVQARAASETQPQQLILIAPAVGRFAMPQVARNSLVVHGDKDEVVELSELLNWAGPQHLHIQLLAGAEHFFHGRLVQLRELVLQQVKCANSQIFT